MLNIYKETELGIIDKYVIQYVFDEISARVDFYSHNWKRSVIIDKLIRTQYSQDRVEAIINNHFLNIAEWIDDKFAGKEVVFEDPEYDKLQAWRKQCKEIANEALEKYPEII